MNEEGIVVGLNQNKTIATVEMTRGAYCEKCNACIAVPESTKIRMQTNNRVNAKVGDRVLVTLRVKESVLAMAISYIFPLFCLILGLTLGTTLSWPEYVTGLASIGGVVLSYLIVRRLDKYLKKMEKFFPLIQKVVVDEEFNPFKFDFKFKWKK